MGGSSELPRAQLTNAQLIELAREAASRAHAPYSGVDVGAILVGASGALYAGANVENASFGVTLCAERVALSKALYEGERRFAKLVVYSSRVLPVPCGACRQFLSEFFRGREEVLVASDRAIDRYLFRDLYPHPFALERP